MTAQPTFRFPTEKYNAGENFCIDVKTRDFTDLLTLDFVITWDPSVIRFTGVQGFNFEDLDISDFDVSQATNGRLRLNWRNLDNMGVTIDRAVEEDYVIFQICFQALGSFGDNTQICIADEPMPIVTRTGTGGINIGLYQEKGVIGVEVLPIHIFISEEEANQGDFVCVDVRAERFINIVSCQFTVEFDSTLLELDGASDFGLPNVSFAGNFGVPQPDAVTFAWSARSNPESLADSALIFRLCFKVKDKCNRVAPVIITGNWTTIEVVTNDEPIPGAGINIGVTTESGRVLINPCSVNSNAVTFIADCPEGLPGDRVCVDVSVRGFQQVYELNGIIKWNAGVLQFESATVVHSTFSAVTLNTAAAPIGTIRFSYAGRNQNFNISIPDGSTVLRLCFTIIGDGTINSSVSFTGSPPVAKKFGSTQNLGINAQNGCVEVNVPPGLTLSAGDYEGFQNEQICVDVKVANFDLINSMQFTIHFEDNVLGFSGVQNIQVPGMTAANFTDLGGGNIEVKWESSDGFGFVLPDGTVVFQLCFDLVGSPGPGACSQIVFFGTPVPVNITSENSGDFNIGLNSTDGNICIIDPSDFTVIGSHETGDLDEIVCVDVSNRNFRSIIRTQYSVNWEVSVATFERIEFVTPIPGFTISNFDFSSQDVGLLSLSWNDPTLAGVTIPDDQVIFRVCFRIVGAANSCTDVVFSSEPLSIIVENSANPGVSIPLNDQPGSICANDYLRLIHSEVIPVNCPGSNSGAINMRTEGGIRPYTFRWNNGRVTESISGITEGTYTVTVTDSAIPPKVLEFQFVVPASGNAPVANAGPDRSINCNINPVQLDGTGSSAGSGITYNWITISPTGGIVPPGERTQRPTVFGPGVYVLEVSNLDCTSRDTVVVTPPVFPIANAGTTAFITCLDTLAELDGTASVGNNLRFSWQPVSGAGQIVTGDNTRQPVVDGPGFFELTVRETVSGCENKDTVEVRMDRNVPIADAGPQMSFPCMADTLTIGGITTSTGPRFVYEWTELEGGNIVADADQSSVQVNAVGLYQLLVTDTVNGCFASDTVRIIGDLDRIQADAGRDTFLTCAVTAIRLNGRIISPDNNYVFEWTAYSGGFINPGEANLLNPTISSAGAYQLMARDTITGCEDFSTLIVISRRETPTATAGPDVNLGCRDEIVPVSGDGSSSGANFTYRWFTNGSGNISDPALLNTSVRGAGTYYFEVTNISNGCIATDSLRIIQDTTQRPLVRLQAPSPAAITCRDTIVQLNAIGSSNGTQFLISWGPQSGIVSGGTSLTPKVNRPGTYILTIIDTTNFCFKTDSVRVLSDILPPVAFAGLDASIPCDPPALQLNGNGSAAGSNIVYTWTSRNGSILSNPTSLRPVVSTPDTYILTVRNTTNGCSSRDSVLISPTVSNLVAITNDEGSITCDEDAFTLTALTASQGTNIVLNWLDEQEQLLAQGDQFEASQPGLYIFEVRDTISGCNARDTVQITEDLETPAADAGADLTFECAFENFTLEGNTNVPGNTFSVLWTSVSGSPVDNENTLNAIIYEGGVYIMTVTLDRNGCSASDTVIINVNQNLVPAAASADIGECEDFALLNGNLPDGVSGIWTTPQTGSIQSPDQSQTLVENLAAGQNTFIWTLSTSECPDYSADTIFVSIAGLPNLRNDFVTMEAEIDQLTISPLLNDDLNGIDNFIFEIIENPASGTITGENNGIITYERDPVFRGSVDIFYRVCNPACPDFCDTAFIKLNIERKEISLDSLLPNTITPNGDGLNETFVFDVIDLSPELYPEPELIVFNRWGDIVFQARPYRNDWGGTNQNGKALPQGTYYYVMRLNLNNGAILRGDVTILR